MVYWKHHRSNWSLKQWRTLPERSPSKGAVLTARIHIGRLISRSTTVQAAFLCISKIGVWSCRATGRTSLPLCWEWCFDALQSHHRRWCDYHRNLQHFWNAKRQKFGARHVEERGFRLQFFSSYSSCFRSSFHFVSWLFVPLLFLFLLEKALQRGLQHAWLGSVRPTFAMVLCLCHFFLRSLLKAPRLELLWRSQNRFSKYGTFLRPQNGWSTGFKGPKFHTLNLEDLTFPKMDGNHLRTLAFWMRKCLAFFKPRAKLRVAVYAKQLGLNQKESRYIKIA